MLLFSIRPKNSSKTITQVENILVFLIRYRYEVNINQLSYVVEFSFFSQPETEKSPSFSQKWSENVHPYRDQKDTKTMLYYLWATYNSYVTLFLMGLAGAWLASKL